MSTPPVPPVPPSPPRSPYEPPSAMGGPLPPGGGEGPRLPWEERERLGIIESLIQTIRLLVTDPSDAFARLRQDGDLVSPILFGIILSWITLVFSQVWQLILGNTFRGLFRGIEGVEDVFAAPSVVVLVATFVFWPVFFVVGLFLFGGLLHLCLMLVGATEKSPTGFEGTLKVYAYSQIAGLSTILPVFGTIVYLIWALVLEVIGFAAVHRTTQGRALVGVLVPLVLCCLCVILGAVFFGAMIAALFSGLSQGAP